MRRLPWLFEINGSETLAGAAFNAAGSGTGAAGPANWGTAAWRIGITVTFEVIVVETEAAVTAEGAALFERSKLVSDGGATASAATPMGFAFTATTGLTGVDRFAIAACTAVVTF